MTNQGTNFNWNHIVSESKVLDYIYKIYEFANRAAVRCYARADAANLRSEFEIRECMEVWISCFRKQMI